MTKDATAIDLHQRPCPATDPRYQRRRCAITITGGRKISTSSGKVGRHLSVLCRILRNRGGTGAVNQQGLSFYDVRHSFAGESSPPQRNTGIFRKARKTT